MTFPDHITTGFDFDEAIGLAELCQRAHQLFTHESGATAGELYNALYGDAVWKFAHAIGEPTQTARALIVQRVNRQQYAVLFWMPEPMGDAEAADKSTGQPIEVKVQPIPVGDSARPAISGSVEYPALPGEVAPPPLGVRVYEAWLARFAACQDAVEQFFSERIHTGAEETAATGPNEVEIYISGHGAGGCLAALCALHLKRRWESRIDFPFFNLKMINFGSPKIGNKAFVHYYTRHMQGYSYRVQNLLDGATFEPSATPPFPYNVQLLLPGVDYVRDGDAYYMTYEHIGEAYILAGVGNPAGEFHFRGPFSSTTVLPFAHNAAGYKQMLIETRKLQETYWKPVQRLAAGFEKQRKQLVDAFQKQKADVQKAVEETVEEVQIQITK